MEHTINYKLKKILWHPLSWLFAVLFILLLPFIILEVCIKKVIRMNKKGHSFSYGPVTRFDRVFDWIFQFIMVLFVVLFILMTIAVFAGG